MRACGRGKLNPLAWPPSARCFTARGRPGEGPTEEQAATTIARHMTKPARFAVWPTGDPPKDHPVPPAEARPLVQWASKACGAGHKHKPGEPSPASLAPWRG